MLFIGCLWSARSACCRIGCSTDYMYMYLSPFSVCDHDAAKGYSSAGKRAKKLFSSYARTRSLYKIYTQFSKQKQRQKQKQKIKTIELYCTRLALYRTQMVFAFRFPPVYCHRWLLQNKPMKKKEKTSFLQHFCDANCEMYTRTHNSENSLCARNFWGRHVSKQISYTT